MKKQLAAGLVALLLCLSGSALAKTAAGGLEYGDRGDEVLRLQQALDTLGYKVGKVDGSFGAYTENALRAFQKAHGLSVDGIAGTKTREAIYALAEGRTAVSVPQATAAPASSVQTVVTGTVTQADGSFFGGNYTSIYPGTKSTRVVLLQTALNQLGYSCGKADGSYGTATKNAVKAFQKANRLTVDGIAGKNTLKKMESLKAGSASPNVASPVIVAEPVTQPTLTDATSVALGMTGAEVTTLQTKLKTLGYYTGSVDGNFGSGTLSAVMAFQRDQGLTQDGIAGKKTVAALDSAISAKQAASQASAQTATVVYRNLNTGATGSDVTSLQTALKNLAYEVSVTGTYDSTTKAAVKAFQKQNGLTVDGVAGKLTQTKLYAGNAVAARASGVTSGTSASSTQTATASTGGPSKSEIKLLHWFNDIKPTLKNGQTILVYDPSTGISWNLRLYSLGRHADAEPLTAQDTANMEKAFGNTNTWNQKAVYVRLPNGVWTIGSTHDMPHLSGSVKDNNFNGHLCVHFLRDMSECEKNDPKYGVANQNTIRSAWKSLTGETISY